MVLFFLQINPDKLPKDILLSAALPVRQILPYVRPESARCQAVRLFWQSFLQCGKIGPFVFVLGRGRERPAAYLLEFREMIFPARAVLTAKAIKVGGTCRSMKVPDMLSYRRLRGCPVSFVPEKHPAGRQRVSPNGRVLPQLSKYSCRVRRIFR